MNVAEVKNCRKRRGQKNSLLQCDKLREAVRVKRSWIDLLP